MDNGASWIGLIYVTGFGRDLCGYLASILVLATFSMTSMRRLRIAAIASNIAFITYALTAHLQPILLLHGILLPLNIIRLIQIERASTACRQCRRDLQRTGTGAFGPVP